MSLYSEAAKFKQKILRSFGVEPDFNGNMKENGEFRLLSELSNHVVHDCVVDIGASHGEWTKEAMRRFKAKEFICFEPMPSYLENLRAEFRDHNVTIYPLAASDESKVAAIQSLGGGGRLHMKPHLVNGGKSHSVHSVRLETGDAMLAGRKPFFIKIDCEGHDAKVLRGLENTLRRASPIVQFEYCDMWILAEETLGRTAEFLNDLGYSLFRIWPDRLTPYKHRSIYETFSYQNFVARRD